MAKKPTPAGTPITYADAGVDIDRANRTKQRIKYLAHKTFTRGVLSEIGGFGGLFAIDKTKYLDPILVSSVDGVGTKLKIAFEMGLHSTVGADLVNHCVNDIAVQGATPLFFMDYLAAGKLDPTVAEQVVEGIADACKHNGCALIGGETAEMPGFYPDGEYDLAGFIVGVVERERIITGKDVQIGDVVLGLPSNGLHTNGYSLARKLLFEVAHYSPDDYVNERSLWRSWNSKRVAVGKMVGRGEDDHHSFAKQLQVVEAIVVMVWAAVDRNFEFAALEPILQVARIGIDDFEVEAGMMAADAADHIEQRRRGDGAHYAESQFRAIRLFEFARLLPGALRVLVDVGQMGADHPAKLSQMGVGPLAAEQCAAELILQQLIARVSEGCATLQRSDALVKFSSSHSARK